MTSPVPVAGPLGEGAYYTFTPNIPGFTGLTRRPSGAVGRDLARRAALVEAAAKQQVPIGRVRGGPGTKRTAGRNLRDTIRTRIAYTAWQPPVAYVGSDHPIALIHHEGSRPHLILPRKPGGVLVFYPRGQSTPVFARRVNHPGTKPNHYLTGNLHLAVQ